MNELDRKVEDFRREAESPIADYHRKAAGIVSTSDHIPNEVDPVRVLAPPSNPMRVARAYIADEHTDNDGVQLIQHCRDTFYVYDGTCWPEAEGAGVKASLYRWLEDAVYEKGGNRVDWAPTKSKVSNVVESLQSAGHLSRDIAAPSWLSGSDDPPADEMLSVGNGLLHIPTRKLVSHSPRFWSHHSLPFDYDRDAAHPVNWLAFLDELWGDDSESLDALQEMFGYCLTVDTSQQKMFMMVGPKRSGKGTIGRILTGLLGQHNVVGPTLSDMASDFGLSPLIDKPLAIISDARLSTRSNTSAVVEKLLRISGEDLVEINRKNLPYWSGRLPTRFLILSNEAPRLQDTSGAFTSRFVMLVLTRSFFGNEDLGLTNRLLEERAGILNWALDGLDRLNERGHFVQPAASLETFAEFEDLSSQVGAFVRDKCVVGDEYSVPRDALFQAWLDWCHDQGRSHTTTKEVFAKDLRAAVPEISDSRPREDGDRVRVYVGVGLAADYPAQPELVDPM